MGLPLRTNGLAPVEKHVHESLDLGREHSMTSGRPRQSIAVVTDEAIISVAESMWRLIAKEGTADESEHSGRRQITVIMYLGARMCYVISRIRGVARGSSKFTVDRKESCVPYISH